jgi:hypothetical protein
MFGPSAEIAADLHEMSCEIQDEEVFLAGERARLSAGKGRSHAGGAQLSGVRAVAEVLADG